MIRISVGTAELLGINNSVSKVLPTTAYLMSGEHCTNNCSFCTQANDSSGAVSRLSRVTWPEYSLSEAINGLSAAYKKGSLKRVCIQVVQCNDDLNALVAVVSRIKASLPDIPLSVSAALDSLEAISMVIAAGADMVNLSLDGASPSVFENVKKRSWDSAWSLLTDAAGAFPGRIRTHLIVGLGEEERDIAETVQKCTDMNIGVGLFAFTPVKGTPLENRPQPPLASYRKLQAAVYLITDKYARAEQFTYDTQESIRSFGITLKELEHIFNSGKAFETSGCPGCNRPYYNESPRQIPYNYPQPLTKEETKQAIETLFSELT
jgi:biotin synthase